VFAAQHYLLTWRQLPPARFDVVTIDGADAQWLQAAFDAG
jgi:putative endonuclease